MEYCDYYHLHMLFVNFSFLVNTTAAALLTGVIVSLIAVSVVGMTAAAFLWGLRRKSSNYSYILLNALALLTKSDMITLPYNYAKVFL